MERKTKVHAEEGKQEIVVTREFDLPVALLFKAHADPDIFEQWMSHEYGTMKVLKFENRKHGGWEFQTSDAQGNVVIRASGVFHEFLPDTKITRTFEMEKSPFGVQLEFLEFERLTDDTSKLTMHSLYRTRELRDQMIKLPFAHGLNLAHNRLQDLVSKLTLK